MTLLHNLWHLLTPHRKRLLGALLAMVLAALAVLLFGQGLRLLIDQGFAAHNSAHLSKAALLLILTIFVLAFASFNRSYHLNYVGEQTLSTLRQQAYQRLIAQSPAWFETKPVGEVVARLVADSNQLQSVITAVLPTALRNGITLTGGLLLMLASSPSLALWVLLAIPLVLLPIVFFIKKLRILTRKAQDQQIFAASYVEETLNSIRTVQAFTFEACALETYHQRVEAAANSGINRSYYRALLAAIVIALVFSAITTILWIGGQEVLQGTLSAGDLSAFVFYAVLVAASSSALSETGGELQKAAGALERLLELTKLQSPIIDSPNPKFLSQPLHLVVKDIHFTYPSATQRPILNGLSCSLVPGDRVGIVGVSGSGKTTLFQLLLRFYEAQSGTILLNHHPLDGYRLHDIRRNIALVPQDPQMPTGTVRHAVCYGLDITPEALEEVAHKADIAGFIQNLPNGWETEIGEKGVRLSGGQRQRLALARALLRKPAMLLLDEATSAVDAISEQKIKETLNALPPHCIALVIAHRLATIQHLPRLMMLENGQVAAEGTHQTLLQNSALYRKLISLQQF
jgi:ATP-binding cassette, subfamily B, bacterial